jgi:hypothetical protein
VKNILSECIMIFPRDVVAILPITIGDEITATKIFENNY